MEEIVALLEKYLNFKYMNNKRSDLAIFTLGEVVVEFFPSKFQDHRRFLPLSH